MVNKADKEQNFKEVVIDEINSNLDLETNEETNDSEPDFDPYDLYEQDSSERLIIPLLHPVTIKTANSGKHTFEQALMRRPKGGDLRKSGAAKNDIESGLILIQYCCQGFTQKLVDELWPTDIARLSEVLNFLAAE